MGSNAIPEMGKTVGGEVLKSKVQFEPFLVWGIDPQKKKKSCVGASAVKCLYFGEKLG